MIDPKSIMDVQLFITGTDTGVGKTFCTGLAALYLLEQNLSTAIFKPVQTGAERNENQWLSPDLAYCAQLAQTYGLSEKLSLKCSYFFEPACSPHLAAQMADETISLEQIKNDFDELVNTHDAVLVEGAGGILVPLSKEASMLDLAESLSCPILLVTRPNLGTLNHTALSKMAINQRGLKLQHIAMVTTEATEAGFIEEDNQHVLDASPVPYIPGILQGGEDLQTLVSLGAKFFE